MGLGLLLNILMLNFMEFAKSHNQNNVDQCEYFEFKKRCNNRLLYNILRTYNNISTMHMLWYFYIKLTLSQYYRVAHSH